MFSAFKDTLKKNFVKIIAHFLIVVFVVGIIPFNAFKGTAKAQNLVETNGNKNKPKEIADLRTETTKTYDNGDGTYTDEIFSKPIHFKENGKWIDIDSNIKESDSSTYENKSNKFKVKFSRKSKSIELTSFLINEKKLSYSLIDLPSLGENFYTSANDVTPTIEENKITYKEIFDGVDIRQTVVDDGVKEDIILKKYNGKNSFAFKIKMAAADVVKETDGSVSIYSKNDNEKIFTFPKPYMVDSNIDEGSGEPQRSDNVQYEIEKHGANIYIKVIADDNWLKSSDRKFPVYIDPSTNININGDAYVSSAYSGNNYNADWNSSDGYYQLKTGYYDSTTGTNFSYLKFDLSSLKGKLVTSAALKIYCEHSYYTSTANAVWLDTVNTTWNPGTITWSNKPASTAYTSTNAVRSSWASFDVTKAVAGWVSVPPKGTNYGFKLHENGNGQTYWKKFRSSGNSSSNPYIAVTYSAAPLTPTGAVVLNNDNTDTGYINLSWKPVAGATGYKVAIFNGISYEYFDVKNVTSWTTHGKKIWPTYSEIQSGRYQLHHDNLGTELAVDPRPVYANSKGSYIGQLRYALRVNAYNANGETATSEAYVGTFPMQGEVYLGEEDFYPLYNNEASYGTSETNTANGNLYLGYNDLNIDGRGLDLTVRRNFNIQDGTSGILGTSWSFNFEANVVEKSNGDIAFTDEDGSCHIFVKNGTKYESPAGIFLELKKNTDGTYTITDRDKKAYTFNGNGKLISIADGNKNTITLKYDSSTGKLMTITDAAGRTLTFTYGTNLISITDSSGRKIDYVLTGGRLTRVNLYYKDDTGAYKLNNASGESTYSYGTDGSITVSDPSGRKIIYKFTNNKLTSITKPISIYSSDGSKAVKNVLTNFNYDTANNITTVTRLSSDNSPLEKEAYRINSDGTMGDKILYPSLSGGSPINIHYEYNGDRQVTEETDGNGNTTTYSYDDLSRLISKEMPSTVDIDGNEGTSTETSYTYSDSNNPYKATEVIESEFGGDGSSSHKTSFQYDANGNLIKETKSLDEGRNLITEYEYDSYGNIKVKRVNRDNDTTLSTKYEYGDGNIYLKEITETKEGIFSDSRKTTFEYDINTGYKKSETAPNGTKTSYEYDVFGNVTRETKVYRENGEEKSVSTSYTYDVLSNQKSVTNPLGYITNYVYDEDSHLIITENPGVNVITDYDMNSDNVTKTPNTIRTYNLYDEVGNLVKTIDGRGNTTISQYDGIGRQIKVTDPEGNVSETKYDNNNNKISEADVKSDGNDTTFYKYDGLNRLIGQSNPETITGDVSPSDIVYQTKYYYDGFGNNIKTTILKDDNTVDTTKQKFDFGNRLIYVWDSSNPNIETWYDYDNLDNKISDEVTNQENTSARDKTLYKYDTFNRLTTVTDPKGNVTKYEYDDINNTKTTTKAEGDKTVESFDGLDRLKVQEILDKDGNLVKKTSNEYDAAGNVKTEVVQDMENNSSKSQRADFIYDELGRKIEEAVVTDNNSGTKIIRKYQLDANGNIETSWLKDYSQSTDGQPLKNVVKTSYDKLNREKSDVTLDGYGTKLQSNSSSYDDVNRTMSFSNSAGSTTVKFDEGERISNLHDDIGDFSYSYYENELLQTLTQPSNTVKFDYDNGKIKKIDLLKKGETSPIKTFTYTYNSNGKLETVLKDNAKISEYHYSEAGQLKSAGLTDADMTTYDYDSNGNLLKVIDKKNSITKEFTFGEDDRIKTQTVTKDGVKKEIQYSFDDASGNLTRIKDNARDISYEYNGDGDLIHIISKITENNITKTKDISYRYDADGKRIGKTVIASGGNTSETVDYTYYYDNDVIVREEIQYKDRKDILSFFTDNDGQLLGMKFKEVTKENEGQEQTYYYQCNNRGDIIGLTNADGDMVAEYSYEPWGKATVNEVQGYEAAKYIATVNPYRFVGKYGVFYDTDSELYLMSIRDYDSDTGRFIEPDTYEGEEDAPFSQNKYLYAEGDPVNNIDPSGQWAIDAMFLVADAAAFAKNPSLANAAWVAFDSAAFIDPSGAVTFIGHGGRVVEFIRGSKRAVTLGREAKIFKIGSKAKKFRDYFKWIDKDVKYARSKAVREAWKEEVSLIKKKGRGTRNWTKAEKEELLKNGKVKGYYGHHINSVKDYPELAGNPDNIRFVTRKKHLKIHKGNWRNATTGKLINRRF